MIISEQAESLDYSRKKIVLCIYLGNFLIATVQTGAEKKMHKKSTGSRSQKKMQQ
jgi:hypothetical protein